ncbi:hypothetical protein HYN59_02105 [Flavobacterium album]|uniref:TraB/GumN family protein n=1 Tax=Flavobacterium album TaxID=2175091 RepID=A0A2S1QUD6_9FLAO|nr:DUF5694 domain-containing protein [Flavobacterium album]AWH83976.1 hypothetical protein HYN59_02105 [Flavobacterium album]
MQRIKTIPQICLLLFCLAGFAQQKVKVHLIATYHMGGTTDALKVDGTKDNILGPERQKQINALLDILQKKDVEKIYVENTPDKQKFWDSIYTAYYTKKPVALRNEIFQIGIKLAQRLNIRNGVKCIDWAYDESAKAGDRQFTQYAIKMNRLCDSLGIGDNDFTVYDNIVLKQLSAFNDNIPSQDLTAVFRKLNSKDYLNKLFYANITTYLDKNAEGTGAFFTQYNMMRNVNIYSNIMRDILTDRPQSVLVLYGAGHIKALKDMFQAHPLIEVVEFEDYFKE